MHTSFRSIDAAIDSSLVPSAIEPPRPRTPVAGASPHSPIATAREMVETLDTLTTAGQRHVMRKVADFIVAELRARWLAKAGPIGRPSLARSIQRLDDEPERMAPAVRPFKRRASTLLALLQAGPR